MKFLDAKIQFDKEFDKVSILQKSIVPVDGKLIENIKLRNESNKKLEEYLT